MKSKRVRGGACNDIVRDARCGYRYRHNPGNRNYDLGFRCCFPPFFVIKRKVKK